MREDFTEMFELGESRSQPVRFFDQIFKTKYPDTKPKLTLTPEGDYDQFSVGGRYWGQTEISSWLPKDRSYAIIQGHRAEPEIDQLQSINAPDLPDKAKAFFDPKATLPNHTDSQITWWQSSDGGIFAISRSQYIQDGQLGNIKNFYEWVTDPTEMAKITTFLEPVQNLFSNRTRKAKTVICKLVFSFLSQFFHSLRFFSSHAKDLSTTHLLGITTNLCNSFRLTTSTVAPIIRCISAANFSPV